MYNIATNVCFFLIPILNLTHIDATPEMYTEIYNPYWLQAISGLISYNNYCGESATINFQMEIRSSLHFVIKYFYPLNTGFIMRSPNYIYL